MCRVVNYHSSWARQQQVELFDASGNPGSTAGSGFNPAGGAPGARVAAALGGVCGFCGGKHSSTQCVGVQGSCNLCGQYGHFARVCPTAGAQQTVAQPQGRGGPQQAQVNAFTREQAEETPSRVIGGRAAIPHSHLPAGIVATMRRVVNYHSSWARQQQVELFDASGNPGSTAGRGFNPAGGAPGDFSWAETRLMGLGRAQAQGNIDFKSIIVASS
ncbi:hypothetical protein F511_26781 [Dorcoceras hygrometricum]|uniref:CCHC-type domain-containing protein n=1 Tax=Dorcoceras hygrometricum TaxID=472368 RepID=A0A2Z7CTR7_9LAMI|nr:hypothetical protein F511_26781 [Dorcoceras hygrometricum]